METYETIKQWKEQHISSFLDSSKSLNEFHDQVMLKVLKVALRKMNKGPIPCQFTWFITGSGGRLEQGLISDQDHGIVYLNSNGENEAYFLALGEEISYGLHIVGYPYCKGNIMSSNPVWCKSIEKWENQLMQWMEDESWEVMRYLQIFYDARQLFGNPENLVRLKKIIYQYQLQNPNLLKRIAANMKHVKNAIGPMGQIMVEQYGIYQGYINLKYTAFIPYVNSIRLLSIKEGVFENSTVDRLEKLSQMEQYKKLLKHCKSNFLHLIDVRMTILNAMNYDDTHYLNVKKLTNDQRKEIKKVLKDGKSLHDHVMALILQ